MKKTIYVVKSKDGRVNAQCPDPRTANSVVSWNEYVDNKGNRFIPDFYIIEKVKITKAEIAKLVKPFTKENFGHCLCGDCGEPWLSFEEGRYLSAFIGKVNCFRDIDSVVDFIWTELN